MVLKRYNYLIYDLVMVPVCVMNFFLLQITGNLKLEVSFVFEREGENKGSMAQKWCWLASKLPVPVTHTLNLGENKFSNIFL